MKSVVAKLITMAANSLAIQHLSAVLQGNSGQKTSYKYLVASIQIFESPRTMKLMVAKVVTKANN